MPIIKQINKDFYFKNNRLVLSPQYLEANRNRFKKITGSRFAAILGYGAYTTPMKTWAMMVNIYKEEMDETLAFVGNAIEPKIRQYAEQILNLKFLCHDPKKVGWDVFKENKIFGGIPDGEPVDKNGNLLYPKAPMLEIKTTSIDAFLYKHENGCLRMQKDTNGMPLIKESNKKRDSWFDLNGNIVISKEYQYQLALYLYLRNITTGVFAICFLKQEDYAHPEKFDASAHEIKLVNFSIDLEEFKKEIDNAKNWYEQHIKLGISPEIEKDESGKQNRDLNWLSENGIGKKY